MFYTFEELSAKPQPLDQVSPPMGNRWALTISPPKRVLPFKLCMLMDLLPYEQFMLNGQLVMHPEFERARLHYHGSVYVNNDEYGRAYQFFAVMSAKDRYHFRVKQKVGVTKTGKIKYKVAFKGYHQQKVEFCPTMKGGPIDEGWTVYCNKHKEETEKILGFSVITKDLYIQIKRDVLKEYIIELV